MNESNNVIIYRNEGADATVQNYLLKSRGFSSRLLRFIKQEGTLLIEGKSTRLYETLRHGGILVVQMPEEEVDAEPEDKPLEIVYEDLDVLVVNKEPYMVTHATKGHPENHLANRVANYFIHAHIHAKIRFVNRLDRDTTGLVVIAKSKFAHQHLQLQMKEKQVEKVYYGLAQGRVTPLEGVVDLPIGRLSDESIERGIMDTGKASVTRYRTLKSTDEASFLRFHLETGRTHQIRVHMKALGHPLLGDSLYNPQSEGYGMTRQALHGGEMQFFQPRSGERISMTAPLPEDMKVVMTRLFNEKSV